MTSGRDDRTHPHFTVIIPNRNRAQYLAHTLATCAQQRYERLEVIVSDDASTEDTRSVVEAAAARDPRIRFIGHEHGLGMRDNFEFALSQAKPGFVIALGGDDGLIPDGIEGMARVLRDTGTELLSWPAPLFTYPGVRGGAGQLIVYRRHGVHVVESQRFLERQARDLHYLGDLESPMFYVKGVVSTRLIEQVRARSSDGRFYSCPTPDGYSGIVLAGEVDRYAFSGEPFSLYAASPESQGLAYLGNDDRSKRASDHFLKSVQSRPMHPELASQPYSPLITLMTVDYLLTCRDLPGWGGRVPPIDFQSVLRKSLDELSHGLYGDQRLLRELRILRAVARHHRMEPWFTKEVTRRKRYSTRRPFEGTGVNASAVLFDASDYGLRTVVDAAYAARTLSRAVADASPRSLWNVFSRSVRYRLASMRKGDAFPAESEWAAPV